MKKWLEILGQCLDGKSIISRGMPVREITNVCYTIKSGEDCLPNYVARMAHPVFAQIELMWILSGDDRCEVPCAYVPRMAEYAEGEKFEGAYGPRIAAQLPMIYQKFQLDLNTRRAVLNIYDFHLDKNIASKDVPCNVAMHFMARDNLLHLKVFTRSQDMWIGYVYDQLEWQILQHIVASMVGLMPGDFTHFISSAHIYEKDVNAVQQLLDSPERLPGITGIEYARKGIDYSSFASWLKLYTALERDCRTTNNNAIVFENIIRLYTEKNTDLLDDIAISVLLWWAKKRGYEFKYCSSDLPPLSRWVHEYFEYKKLIKRMEVKI